MATKAVLQLQPKGDDKAHVRAPKRNQRVVLGDRTNTVVDARIEVKGKPPVQISRPLTRRFHAELLGKKVSNKENSIKETVVLKTTDEDEKKKTLSRCKPVEGSKKEVMSFTSILTARSKVLACEVPKKPKEQIVNIDAADVNDELQVVDYVDDLYKFYKLAEEESRVEDYLKLQPDINSKMRLILINWLIQVHRKYNLRPETLYLTVNIIDRYLSMKTVNRRELQLVGISSMVIASKYEEVWAPQVNEFVCLSDFTYTGNQIRIMEKAILGTLEWYLTVPTTYVFLARYIKASIPPDDEMKNMVFFLAELGVLHYETIVRYSASMMAAAAVYAARCTLNKNPLWTETLKHYTGYSEEQLRCCAKLLVGFHFKAAESAHQAAYLKYSKPEYGAVARLTPAKGVLKTLS